MSVNLGRGLKVKQNLLIVVLAIILFIGALIIFIAESPSKEQKIISQALGGDYDKRSRLRKIWDIMIGKIDR